MKFNDKEIETMLTRLNTAIQGFRRRRQTIRELSRLTDRELRDLGISRCDIYSIADLKQGRT